MGQNSQPSVPAEAWRLELTKQMFILFLGKGGGFVLTLAIPLVLVRIFDTTQFGVYRQIVLIQGTLLAVLSFGIPASLYYFLPREVSNRGRYISQTVLLLAGIGLFACTMLSLFRREIATLLNSPDMNEYAPYIGVLAAASLLAVILEVIMVATKRMALATLTVILSEFIKSCVIIGAALVTKSLFVLLIGMIALAVLRIGALIIYLLKEKWLDFHSLSMDVIRGQLVYALPFGIATTFEIMASAVPQFFVSYKFDPATFAVFSVGCFTLPFVPLLFDAVADAALIRITELEQGGHYTELRHVVSDAIRKLSLVCLPLFVFLIFMSREFITVLYTNKFQDSIPIFVIFSFTLPLWALSLDYVPRAFHNTSFLLRMYGVRLALTIILLLVLTPMLGLPGAALAVVLALGISRFYVLKRVAHLTGVTVSELVPWRSLAVVLSQSLIAGLILLLFRQVLSLPPLVVLLAGFLVFASIYLSLIWNSKVVHDDERRVLTLFLYKLKGLVVRQPCAVNK